MVHNRQNTSCDPSSIVLVAILNNQKDFQIARDQHWYRIPLENAPRGLHEACYLALYLTKAFEKEKWTIRYYAEILRKLIVRREDLFPHEPHNPKTDREYYKIEIGPLQERSKPIISRGGRRMVFITTTWERFWSAEELNDLFHESPLEDRLWEHFKKEKIEAERQYYVRERGIIYCLDFAIFCREGKIDIECDGDAYHTGKDKALKDNVRNNELETQGWSVLRFSSEQIHQDMPECISTVKRKINNLGGLPMTDGRILQYNTTPGMARQLDLFGAITEDGNHLLL